MNEHPSHTTHESGKLLLQRLEAEVGRVKGGKNLHDDFSELDIVTRTSVHVKRKGFLNRNRVIVFGIISFFYLSLIVIATYLEVYEDTTSVSDPRFVATFLTKLLDWLFVTGPSVTTVESAGITTYQLHPAEILRWIVHVLISLIGWGSIISIPTFLIDSFIQNAGLRDEGLKAKIKEEEEKIAQAKVNGRLAIHHPEYNLFFTKTYDPIIPLLMKSFKIQEEKTGPWILVQNGDQFNKINSLITDHIYLPDLANGEDYQKLLNIERLSNHQAIILSERPGSKFLSDTQNVEEVDLTLSEIVMFIENIRERAHKVKLIICGSKELQSLSESFKGKTLKETTNLEELAKEVGANFVDPDEVILERIYEYSTNADPSKKEHRPIFIEFTSRDQEKINFYKEKFGQLLKKYKDIYPISVTDKPEKASGGVYFFGEDVEGVALAKKTTNFFPGTIPHYIIFEPIDRIDEVEAMGFEPICIDYELSKAILKAYLSQ